MVTVELGLERVRHELLCPGRGRQGMAAMLTDGRVRGARLLWLPRGARRLRLPGGARLLWLPGGARRLRLPGGARLLWLPRGARRLRLPGGAGGLWLPGGAGGLWLPRGARRLRLPRRDWRGSRGLLRPGLISNGMVRRSLVS